MLKKASMTIAIMLCFTLSEPRPGDRLFALRLCDVNGDECWLDPACGRPSVIFYDDYGDMDTNTFFLDMISGLSVSGRINIYRVISMEPAWYMPDRLIYCAMDSTVENTKSIMYFFDDNENLRIKWRLKECYDGSAVLVLSGRGILLHEIYGAIEPGQAAAYRQLLESLKAQ